MTRIACWIFAGLAGLCLGVTTAQAASDCILDNCADKRPPVATPQTPQNTQAPSPQDTQAAQNTYTPRANRYAPQPSGASQPGDFDFYVLSLSWSSGFCATGGSQKARDQCAPGAGLGFVVHGLWPQYESGFPQDCGPAGRYPSRMALDSVQGLYPDIGLARYEWRKHGTCSGKSPTDYFADVRRARDAVVVPPQFAQAKSDQTWSPIDILRAFEAANPRLRPGMSAIGCRSGVLEEVRFCLSKDLRDFRACPQVARGTCRAGQLQVPAPL